MSGETSQTVLVVDDEPLILEVCGAVLRASGYTVLCSSNGQAGLERFRSCRERLDLVIADMVMPDLTGMDMTGKMLEEAPSLKVVYMSGYGSATVWPKRDGQHVQLLVKPFTSEQFLRFVKRALNQATANGAA